MATKAQLKRSLKSAASRLASAEKSRKGTEARLAKIETTIKLATRTGDSARSALLQARSLTRSVATLKSREANYLRRLESIREQFLDSTDPSELLENLRGTLPICLLPVRLETRFQRAGRRTELLIRIYPDDIHVDTHEPELTDDEERVGKSFWEATWRAGGSETEELTAWQVLCGALGPERAGWVANALTPSNDPHDRPSTPMAADDDLPTSPDFPDPDGRADSWTRAPHTKVMPDRWVAIGYKDDSKLFTTWGAAVPDPLPVGPDPSAEVGETSEDVTAVDPGMLWMVDFEEAERIGMGIRVSLSTIQARRGIDQLIVLGVKSTLDSNASADRLSELLDAHRYTRGLSLVSQGTPTNNTSSESSGYRSQDPEHRSSFDAQRQGALFEAGDGSDGDIARSLLGLNASSLEHTPGAGGTEQQNSRHMNTALWPATLGYFLENMAGDDISNTLMQHYRRYFIDYVRGRGPLPSVRVGNQPYGILPSTSMDLWKARTSKDNDSNIVSLLRMLRTVWRNSLEDVPKIGGSDDPDQDLLDVLSMDATSVRYQFRNFQGRHYARNLFSFMGRDPGSDWWELQETMALKSIQDLGFDANLRMSQGMFSPAASLVGSPMIQSGALSETDTLEPNYIRALRRTSLAGVRRDRLFRRVSSNSLLYQVLRHASLLEYEGAANKILSSNGLVTSDERKETELVNLESGKRTSTPWTRLNTRVSDVTGRNTLSRYLFRTTDYSASELSQLGEFRESLDFLAGTPTAELDRLFKETLDLCSHRFDAYATSLATKRLNQQRDRYPTGLYLGGFGWVENLSPGARQRRVRNPLGEGRDPLYAAAESGGYIHAPSLAQATTAAVFRSGYLSHQNSEDENPMAVDLSSRRLRLAMWLLDGVRQGQPLGALLGYRFERGLHENHPTLELDKYVDAFRDLAPLVANKMDGLSAASEAVAASNVVDGLTLHRRWKQDDIPFGDSQWELPSSGNEFNAIEEELAALDDALDAISDATTVESVHQVLQGNSLRSSASLDAMSRGEAPPAELEVARTPRTGVALTQRVLVLFSGDAQTPSGWPTNAAQARAQAEPHLNSWAAQLLGDPTRVLCRYRFLDTDGNAASEYSTLGLDALELSPLDLISIADRGEETQASELEQRIAYHLMGTQPSGGASVELTFARDETWDINVLSFAQFLEVQRSAQRVISGGRAVDAEDLSLPEEESNQETNLDELTNRAEVAASSLTNLGQELDLLLAGPTADIDLGQTRDVLFRISYFGVAGAIPMSAGGSLMTDRQELLLRAQSVGLEVATRLQGANASPDPQARLSALFGASFRALPRFTPGNASELGQSFASQNTLLNGDTLAPVTWSQQVSKVRDGVFRLHRALSYSEALGNGAVLDFSVAQLPHDPDGRWVGLSQEVTAGGIVSIVAHAPNGLNLTQSLAGLFIDEWVEVVPNSIENTAVSFHYDGPDAMAPQSILLAVRPDGGRTWDLDTLEAVVRETLELAKLRTGDPDSLQDLGHYLPALYFASNAAGDTISLDINKTLE